MTRATRRTFLKRSGLGMGGATLALATAPAKAIGANERILVGVIGCGGRGGGLAEGFAQRPESKVIYVCDPDDKRCGRAKEGTGADHAVADPRRVLDDKSVDAVVVATPDHWHSPAAILACEAGKHVYVEKPCSHNIREGRLLVEAARRNRCVVQHGTQNRSSEFVAGVAWCINRGVLAEVDPDKICGEVARSFLPQGLLGVFLASVMSSCNSFMIGSSGRRLCPANGSPSRARCPRAWNPRPDACCWPASAWRSPCRRGLR